MSTSPTSTTLSEREVSHVRTIRKLCRMLMDAQKEEDSLLEEVHRTLSFDVLRNDTLASSPPLRDTSSSSAPNDTVDSKRVWGRLSQSPQTAPQGREDNISAQLQATLETVRKELCAERARSRKLEAEVEFLRSTVARLQSSPSAKEQTPQRPIANILLRESTQKLLREAEEELFHEKDFSFQS